MNLPVWTFLVWTVWTFLSSCVYEHVKRQNNHLETNRWGMLTSWSTEQAIREIYLKPFEICVKDANATGTLTAVMTSYNYIGGQWAGACAPLLSTVLRGEWGYEGFCLTDYFANFYYMDATRSIYNGGDTCLINTDQVTNYVTDRSATTISHLRDAAHHILYVTGNSRAHAEENLQTGLMAWQRILLGADIAVALLILLIELFIVRRGYGKRKVK